MYSQPGLLIWRHPYRRRPHAQKQLCLQRCTLIVLGGALMSFAQMLPADTDTTPNKECNELAGCCAPNR